MPLDELFTVMSWAMMTCKSDNYRYCESSEDISFFSTCNVRIMNYNMRFFISVFVIVIQIISVLLLRTAFGVGVIDYQEQWRHVWFNEKVMGCMVQPSSHTWRSAYSIGNPGDLVKTVSLSSNSFSNINASIASSSSSIKVKSLHTHGKSVDSVTKIPSVSKPHRMITTPILQYDIRVGVPIIPRPTYDYRNVILPPSISKKEYGENNSNLPKVFYQSEYSALLFVAVANNNVQHIKALLEKNADINAVDAGTGDTPLIYAIKKDKIVAFRYLLLKGADINHKTTHKQTVLHIAALQNKYDFLKIMLTESTVDPSIRDNDNNTAIQYLDVVALNDKSIIIPLIKKYRNLNDALIDFAEVDSVFGVEYALIHGADVNTRAAHYPFDTPLLIAVKRNNFPVVSLLLSSNAEIDVRNAYNETPLDISREKGNDSVATVYNLLRTVMFQRELRLLQGSH